MQEIFGPRGPLACSHRNPLRVAAGALGANPIVLTLVFGKLSWSADGSDSGGFYFGDGGD